MSAFFIIMLLISCSSIEIQFQPNAMHNKPKRILIGAFENRMPEYKQYNPFINTNFRDSLKFEFVRLGYDAELLTIDESKNADNLTCSDKKTSDTNELQKNKINLGTGFKEPIKLCCEKFHSDMFIRGVISILETGELSDTKVSTFVSILMYNKDGEQIGEAHYNGSGQMGDANFIKTISKDFAEKINSTLKRTRFK
jgi:hypothetical protein